MMRNKNLLVILIVLVVAAALAVAAMLMNNRPDTLPEEMSDMAAGYVYINAAGEGRWFELPEQETTLTLRRTAEDGAVIENGITLMPDGAFMAHSTCDNQDCVEQGVVTLDNRETRVLRNLIVCLPNEVYIEVYSAAEVAELAAEQ